MDDAGRRAAKARLVEGMLHGQAWEDAVIAAGLDRSYAAVAEASGPRDVATEIAALGRRIDELARLLEGRDTPVDA